MFSAVPPGGAVQKIQPWGSEEKGDFKLPLCSPASGLLHGLKRPRCNLGSYEWCSSATEARVALMANAITLAPPTVAYLLHQSLQEGRQTGCRVILGSPIQCLPPSKSFLASYRLFTSPVHHQAKVAEDGYDKMAFTLKLS